MNNLYFLLLLTLVVETLILWIYNRQHIAAFRIMAYSLAVNCFTWGALAFLIWKLDFNIYAGEILVVMIELVLIRFLFKVKWINSLLQSVVANVSSYGAGLILSAILYK